jgi:gliding motility-associated-like protein
VIGNDATLTIVPAANQWVFVEGTLLGCTQRDSVFVRLATPPTVTASANVAICAGKSTPLTASGAQTYSWSPVDGLSATNIANPTARPTATTTYTVTGTDAQGCQNTAQVTVTVNPQPVVNLRSDTLICFGTCITLDAGPNGTSYEWFTTGNISNPNIRNPEVCPTADVRYTVQVTGPNGCITRDSVNIFVRPEILAQITPSATSICQGDSVCLTATGAGVYEWFTDDAGIPGPIFGTRQCFFPSQTTTYKMVPGVGPCKGDTVYQTITVRPTPFAAIRAQRLGCTFDTVTVEFVGIRVPNDLSVWSFGTNANVVSGSGFGPYEVYWTLAGRKFITLQVEANGCTSVDTAFIDVFSKPTVDAGSAVEYCQGGAGVVLQGSTFTPDSAASCVYTWTPFAGLDNPFTLNPIARPSVTTTYYLQAFCNSCPSENIDSVVVTVLPRPTAVIDTFQLAFCAGSGGVQLPGSGFGGVGARSYEWFPKNGLSDGFSPTPVANPTVTTEYCLVVRDANNCPSDTACIQVIVHPVPQANAGPDQFLCTGTNQGVFLQGTAIGGGFGSFSYRWEPATGLSNPNVPNPFAAPDSTTIYTLFVTNNLTGCTSVPTTLDTVSTVVVNVTRTPQAVAGPARSICRGESINIGGTPRFCTPNCVFSWTPTLGLSDPTILSPLASPQFTTTYWLTVTNNGCTSIADSVTVTVRPAPTLDILRPVVDICPGDSVRIETTIGGIPANSPVVYQWTPTAGLSDPTAAEPLASPTQTTTYYLAATAEGCVGPVRDSIVVQVFPMPQIDVAQRRILRCNEDADSLTLPVTVTASVEPFFIEWSPANQVSGPTIANPRVRPLESTKYFIRVTTANCVVRDSIEIIVLPAIGAEIEASQPIACRGDEVTLRASGPSAATYSWSPADGLSSTSGPVVTATPDQTTTYVLTVRQDGCEDTASFTLVITPRPAAAFDYSFPEGCGSMTVSFSNQSTEAQFYVWDFGDGSAPSNALDPTHTYAAPGRYNVQLRVNAPGYCRDSIIATRLVDVTDGAPAQFSSEPAAPASLALPYATVSFTDSTPGAVVWLWQFGDGQSSTRQNPTYEYTTPGLYTVTLTATDRNGCTYQAQAGTFTVFDPQLVIANVFTPNGDGVNDFWYPEYTGGGELRAFVFDRFGREMFSGTGRTARWNGNTPSGQPAMEGVYFYQVEVDDKLYKGTITLLR